MYAFRPPFDSRVLPFVLSCLRACVPLLFLLTACGQSPTQVATPPAFSLITYNIQSRPLLDADRARRNLPIIGEKLNEFDIAGVQECFSLADLLFDAADHESRYYFDKPGHWWSLANSGLASLSRFRLLAVKTHHYTNKAETADQVASKGILLTRYDIGGQIVDVYNTHMQAGHSDAAQQARQRQADELARFVEHNSPLCHAVILHGDFNMSPARPGKPWQQYQPQHYASDADMTARTAVFTALMQRLHLHDVSDELFGPIHDHIDRVLHRDSDTVALVPLSWENRGNSFLDAEGKPLSDSSPIVVRFGWTHHDHLHVTAPRS